MAPVARAGIAGRNLRRAVTVAAPSSPTTTILASSARVGRIENPDLPDTWNAVDKMSKKRGYVDAVLSVTGASAIFTQDIGADPSEAEAGGLEHGRSCPANCTARRGRRRSGCAAGTSTRPRSCGKSSKASSTATCRRQPRKRCWPPPRRRPCRPAGPRAQARRRTLPPTTGHRPSRRRRPRRRRSDPRPRRRSAGQSAGGGDESTPTPRRPRARRPRPTRTGRGCGRPRPSEESATRSWRT